MAQRRYACPISEHATYSYKNLLIEVALGRGRRHLDEKGRNSCSSQLPIEVSAIVAQEFLHDASLAHACAAINHQTWHTVVGWIIDQVGKPVQNTFGAGILNPALLPNPRHTLFIAQLSNLVLRRVKVRKLSRAHAHSRSQISTGKGWSSSCVWAGAASTG